MSSAAARLQERADGVPWKKWGPSLSERQWGTVREDYSSDGDAWKHFTHDQARSRAYRWGEDGIVGISDDHQYLCFALALWNGRDPILKERMLGLTNQESNHGEDVKEYYLYLDSTPTHSYMKHLYTYPQAAYPYDEAQDLCRRQAAIFLRDSDGRRPVNGGTEKFQSDPYWRDHLLFFEYFHGDDGADIGASHQTGWTGLVARALQISKFPPDAFAAPRR